jgi:acetyl esterase
MPLDPQAQKVVDAMAALNLKPVEDSTPEEARVSMRARTAALGPFEEVAAVADHDVPVEGGRITVRVYAPGGVGPHPALVFYHGGGWVIGDLDTHDGICRSLANAAGSVVASVDYRLAPEWKYPVAAEDAHVALRWVVDNAGRLGIDPHRVAVGGDSAGGNLATVATLMARERGGPALVYQVLIYPVTNHALDTPPITRTRPDTCSRARQCAGSGDTTWSATSKAGSPTRRRSRRRAWPACQQRSSSPPSAIRSATRAKPTPPGSAMPRYP